MRSMLISFVFGALLTACATTKVGAPKSETSTKTDRLSARQLLPGECGLFVWKSNETKQLLLFAEYAKGRAIWFNGEKEEYLRTVGVGGDPANGQYAYQEFETPDAKTLLLDLKLPETITNGTRFKGGTVTISSGEEWDKVVPVVGLSACQQA